MEARSSKFMHFLKCYIYVQHVIFNSYGNYDVWNLKARFNCNQSEVTMLQSYKCVHSTSQSYPIQSSNQNILIITFQSRDGWMNVWLDILQLPCHKSHKDAQVTRNYIGSTIEHKNLARNEPNVWKLAVRWWMVIDCQYCVFICIYFRWVQSDCWQMLLHT